MVEHIDQALTDLEARIERVRALYEQYFLGIERCEPLVPRKEVQRLFAQLGQRTVNNTAWRFRYQVLLQRWNTHLQRWGKVVREIEAGTYLPHVARAKRRGVALPTELEHQLGHRLHGPPDARPPGEREVEELSDMTDLAELMGEEVSDMTDLAELMEEAQEALPARARSSSTPRAAGRAAASPVPGMSEAELRELHRRYVNERGAAVKYETLMANLERQVPALQRQLGCSRLRFVVVRGDDGQILLRALPQH
ncbi:MAG TPA: hypothetical protein VH877_23040 [Polyangia bacterium]|nr:hypothetical protein [Polyangia bacterium]